MTRKQLYRSTLWGDHHLRQYLPSYAPIQEWRYLSSWGKKPDAPSRSRNKAEANEEEDWYTRWEKQKLRQYDDFMKKVELDPYTVLFGKSWLSYSGENTESKAARTPSPSPFKEASVPNNERHSENWPSKSKPSKLSENRDTCGKQSKSEMAPIPEHDQKYEIDPITNRKVLKTSSPPVSTLGHIKPPVKDGEMAFEHFFKRCNLVSPPPLDRRLFMVENAQALSTSHPPNKDISLKQKNGNGWLAQEGFGNFQEPKADSQPIPQFHNAKMNATATKIESALDRHLSRKTTDEKEKGDHPQLQYKPEENKTDDVDLLRPSDVRASAGFRGNPPKETDVDKQARRQKLEDNYESCSIDRASQLAGEATTNKLVQKREDRLAEESTVPELRFGSWLKGTLQDAKLKDTEVPKGTSAVWVNELSDAGDFDPVSADQNSDSTPVSKNKLVSEPLNAVALEPQAEARDKANKLKAQIVPFKAKLDAMKADYEFLRQQWLQETRRIKEKAAKKEAEAKAQKVAKRAREIHEEEVKAQKVAMEAMEMRSNGASMNAAKTASAEGMANENGEKPAPRRLQSLLQGEGDMASNVHEFAGRDRWYKRKAPHAMDAKDVEMDTKLKKIAADRALIREIRSIYEDTYGTIDTKLRLTHFIKIPLLERPSPPLSTLSYGRVDRPAQLPLSAPSITGSLRGQDESQSLEALEIIQKLFGQLREAQSIILDHRCQTKQAFGSNDPNTKTFELPNTFEQSAMKIMRTSGQLARIRSGGTIEQESVKAIPSADSNKATMNRPLSTTAPESTNPEDQKATKASTYRVLMYDSATKKFESSKVTTLAPFSTEELFLPFDAVNRLSDPGIHLMSLGEKGYEPFSGTSNILVIQKDVIPQDLADIKKTDARTDPNPEEFCQANLQRVETEQQKVKEAQKEAVENVDKENQKAVEARKTAMDGIKSKKQPFEEIQRQQSVSSASPSHTSSEKVHRQEAVFSGSRQGRWVDNNVKPKKSKRGAGRRRKTMKRMLIASAFTAACCYCVGVASEMMHGL